MWEAFAQLGSDLMNRRHADMFNRKAANVAFDREVMMKNWDVQLANSAHQREVADLRAAGLNPILSASKGGGGAVVPSSSHVPQASGVSGGSSVDWAGSSAKSAMANLSKQQEELVRIQQGVATAEKGKIESETALNINSLDNPAAQRLLWDRLGLASVSSAKLSDQHVKESQQNVNESIARVAGIRQQIVESGSRILLNSAQRNKLVEDMAYVKQMTGLTASQRERIDLFMEGVRTESEIDKSAWGEFWRWFDRLPVIGGGGGRARPPAPRPTTPDMRPSGYYDHLPGR